MAAAIMESLRKPLEVLHQTERERERESHPSPPPPTPYPSLALYQSCHSLTGQ